MSREVVSSDGLLVPAGRFSAAVRGGGLVFLSGQVGLGVMGTLVEGGAAVQAAQIFRNIEAVLGATGRGLGDVVRVGVYLADMADYAAVNEIYRQYFEAPYPARTAIGVAALPMGAAVEMDVIVHAA